MEFRVLRDCTALYLAIQALPKCEEATLRPNGEDGELGVSMLWLQNMLGNQSDSTRYGGTITIGRKPGSHINLKDRAISSTHATIRWTVEVRVCPSTQTGDLMATPLKAGDMIRVLLSIVDSSTNGTYDGDLKCEKGKPVSLKPGILTIPGTTNALECIATNIDRGNEIFLGRPKSSEAGQPVFAFNSVVCIAESLTSNVLNLLTMEQMAAFPYGVQRHCFIGCVRDPRLTRIKTEQYGQGETANVMGSSHIGMVQAGPKCGSVGVCIERQQAVRRDLSGGGVVQMHQSNELEELRKQCAQLQSDYASLMSETEKSRAERDRDLREASSKREEAVMELKLLEKKCLTYQQQIQALQNENQSLKLTAQKMQESYELAECKRAQTQTLLETSETRCVTLEGERYKLSVAATQSESRNKTLETQMRELERRFQELEREHLNLTELRRIEAERASSEREQLRAEFDKVRQQNKAIKEQAQKALIDQETTIKKKIRVFVKVYRENAARQTRYLEDMLQTQQTASTNLLEKLESDENPATQMIQPSARQNYAPAVASPNQQNTSKWKVAPAQEPQAPSLDQAADDAADEHCSATDGEDTATVEGADDLATVSAKSDGHASDTPLQQPSDKENEKRQDWLSQDISKRRRRSSSLTGEDFEDLQNSDHLLLPDSQLS